MSYQWDDELSIDCLPHTPFLKYQIYNLSIKSFNNQKTEFLQSCAK